jgi:hypothetical protein
MPSLDGHNLLWLLDENFNVWLNLSISAIKRIIVELMKYFLGSQSQHISTTS